MELTRSKEEFRRLLADERRSGHRVGVVLTMGALHAGHVSLVAAARRRADTVAMTVFVNPLQFGEGEDLGSYPRDVETDAATAEEAGVDVLFAPQASELYPEGRPATTVVPGEIATVLEGAARPSHFVGVATVVTKLLSLAGPCLTPFGEKDYQQLLVVRRLVEDLELPAEVIACPIVREPDGVAMSSRNRRLTRSEREAAPVLYRSLLEGRRQLERTASPSAAEKAMRVVLAGQPLVDVDYAVAVDRETLRPPRKADASLRLLVAARIGATRLIDNLAAS